MHHPYYVTTILHETFINIPGEAPPQPKFCLNYLMQMADSCHQNSIFHKHRILLKDKDLHAALLSHLHTHHTPNFQSFLSKKKLHTLKLWEDQTGANNLFDYDECLVRRIYYFSYYYLTIFSLNIHENDCNILTSLGIFVGMLGVVSVGVQLQSETNAVTVFYQNTSAIH